MSEDFSVPVRIPLDQDGFLRRECPTCEQEFKWFAHEEGSPEAAPADQYFCPLCGVPADTVSWWTPAQLEYANGAAAPAIEQFVQDSLDDLFSGIKGLTVTRGSGSSDPLPSPAPLDEPNDMNIVEPPCHPNEPVKVPSTALARLYCLICGAPYSV